jgi:hypothetical protein
MVTFAQSQLASVFLVDTYCPHWTVPPNKKARHRNPCSHRRPLLPNFLLPPSSSWKLQGIEL